MSFFFTPWKMEIDYIFPQRFFSSKKSAHAKNFENGFYAQCFFARKKSWLALTCFVPISGFFLHRHLHHRGDMHIFELSEL